MDSTVEKILKSKNLRFSKEQKRDFPFVYAVIAFPIIQFIVFWLYVNTSSILMSFQDLQGNFTFDNILMVFEAITGTDQYGFSIGQSLGRSFLIWVLQTGLAFPCSVVTVYVLTCKIRFHYFYRIAYILPGLVGSIIWAAIVRMVFDYNGPIVTLLYDFLPEAAQRNGLLGAPETAFASLVILEVSMAMVGSGPVLTGAFAGVSEEIMESAELDGAGFWRQCFMIAIPCIWPTITTMLIFKITGMFTSDVSVFLYSNGTGEPSMSTIGFQLYYMTYTLSSTGADGRQYGYPAAVGFTLTLMTLPVCLVGRHYLEKLCDWMLG